jgi:hypothetical protein
MVLALVSGCAARSGSTLVRVTPPTGEASVVELRSLGGEQLGRATIEGGAALRDDGRNLVRSSILIENSSDRPLVLPARELYLTAHSLERMALVTVGGQPAPAEIIVPAHVMINLDCGFALADDIDQVRTLHLHWAILQDGARVGGGRTLLASDETTRLYPSSSQAQGIADPDDHFNASNGIMNGQKRRAKNSFAHTGQPTVF